MTTLESKAEVSRLWPATPECLDLCPAWFTKHDEEKKLLHHRVQDFIVRKDEIMKHPKWQEFFHERKKLFLLMSNHLEGTNTTDAESKKHIKQILSKKCGPPSSSYNSEGEGNTSEQWQCQLADHAAAYNYLFEKDELSIEILGKTHGLLTEHAADIASKGVFRNKSASAGFYTFVDHNDIPGAVADLVELVNTRIQQKTHSALQIASVSQLMFLTIHPFENANGRMGRLLFAWILFRCGLPFPVIQLRTSSKSEDQYSVGQSKKEYLQGIRIYQTRTTETRSARFYAFCLECVAAQIQNWNTYKSPQSLFND